MGVDSGVVTRRVEACGSVVNEARELLAKRPDLSYREHGGRWGLTDTKFDITGPANLVDEVVEEIRRRQDQFDGDMQLW